MEHTSVVVNISERLRKRKETRRVEKSMKFRDPNKRQAVIHLGAKSEKGTGKGTRTYPTVNVYSQHSHSGEVSFPASPKSVCAFVQ